MTSSRLASRIRQLQAAGVAPVEDVADSLDDLTIMAVRHAAGPGGAIEVYWEPPASEDWEVVAAAARDVTTAVTFLFAVDPLSRESARLPKGTSGFAADTSQAVLAASTPGAANTWVPFIPAKDITLRPGDKFYVHILNTVALDVLNAVLVVRRRIHG